VSYSPSPEELHDLAAAALQVAYWLREAGSLTPEGRLSKVLADGTAVSNAVSAFGRLYDNPILERRRLPPQLLRADGCSEAKALPPLRVAGGPGISSEIQMYAILRIADAVEAMVQQGKFTRGPDVTGLLGDDCWSWQGKSGEPLAAPEVVTILECAANNLMATVAPTARRPPASPRPADGSEPEAKSEDEPNPKKLLVGWHEIAAALDMNHGRHKDIKSLNDRCEGPIVNKGPGTKPMVYQDDLIEWWNSLAVLQQELANQREGVKLTAEAEHNYARDDKVAPEIGGRVKKRRRDKRT
jgi:hypothetical protein